MSAAALVGRLQMRVSTTSSNGLIAASGDKFLCGLAARGLAPLEIKIRQVEEKVFVKPNAEGKSQSVCTMLRREHGP